MFNTQLPLKSPHYSTPTDCLDSALVDEIVVFRLCEVLLLVGGHGGRHRWSGVDFILWRSRGCQMRRTTFILLSGEWIALKQAVLLV